MGFWHTGYAEFHEPTGLDDYVYQRSPPVRYSCAHCDKTYAKIESLRKHRFEKHPIRQPTLLLRGKPIGNIAQVLRTPIEASEVLVEDASACLLNGKRVTPAVLGQQLSDMRCEFAVIDMSNQGATTRCLLDFQVAEEDHLAGVEAAFIRLARDRVLNINAIAGFNNDCRSFNSAMSYCNGIANYLYGVMAKERSPDSGLRHEEYVQRFMKSSEELSCFNRLLANSVRALVAFHFNHFIEAAELAPEGTLRQAAFAFSQLLAGQPWYFNQDIKPELGTAVEDMLTDQDTLHILDDVRFGLHGLSERTDVRSTALKRGPLDGYNHLKRMLLTCEALAATNDTSKLIEARSLARILADKPETRPWAQSMLERIAIP